MKKIILILTLIILISGCTKQITEEKPGEQAQIANPASVYCEEQGGTLEIRTADDGSQTGYCTLKDGTECEEWAYYRRECPVDKVIEEVNCVYFDGKKEECLSHEECEWDAEENNCDPVGGMSEGNDEGEDDEGNEFESELEKDLPDTIANQICKRLPLANSLNPGDRFYCFALVNHDARFCEKIDDEEKEVNRCLAHAKVDSSYCKKQQDESSKHVCYYMLAVSSEDIGFCDEIDYSQHEKEQCYFSFITNLYWWDKSDEIKTEYCNKLDSPDRNTCLALKSRDVSLCKDNVNCLTFFEQPMSFCTGKGSVLKDCIRDRAMASKDISICEQLSGVERDDCIGDFCTHIKLDTGICDMIKDNIERQSRYVEVAMNLNNGVRMR